MSSRWDIGEDEVVGNGFVGLNREWKAVSPNFGVAEMAPDVARSGDKR